MAAVPAQPQSVPAAPGYTLRVYTNLVEVPTLVLDKHERIERFLDRRQFVLHLDAGPAFHPTHMRVEGDDPIDLAILIDVSGGRNNLARRFNTALARLAPVWLTARDRVTVYAMDCVLIRAGDPAPADPALLRDRVDIALHAHDLHQRDRKGTCGLEHRLWDGIASVAERMQDRHGWRVVLVISDGVNDGGVNSWPGLVRYTDSRSIAIFGIGDLAYAPTLLPAGGLSASLTTAPEDAFDSVCASTGGFLFDSAPSHLQPTLQRFIEMLRQRYILGFPNASNSTAGDHVMDITVSGRKALVRASGVTAEVQDPAIARDPHTISAGPANAPLLGTRHPLPPPK